MLIGTHIFLLCIPGLFSALLSFICGNAIVMRQFSCSVRIAKKEHPAAKPGSLSPEITDVRYSKEKVKK